jgi:hypothetical protein
MTPLVPLAVMVAMVVVTAVMAVNWLRVRGTAPHGPVQAKEEPEGTGPKEGSS